MGKETVIKICNMVISLSQITKPQNDLLLTIYKILELANILTDENISMCKGQLSKIKVTIPQPIPQLIPQPIPKEWKQFEYLLEESNNVSK